MNRDAAIDLLDQVNEAQNEFYAGGSATALEQLLAPDVTWTVPGSNRIAGTYRGLDAVFDYFRRRRDLADRTFRMERRDIRDGQRLAFERGIMAVFNRDRDPGPATDRSS
jgi:SnoaL-like protein